jgi:drug/metabolite transporter (DMT)-like permease
MFITHYKALLFSGILTGAAFSLFTTSLAYTDVIRVILLFYLTPVWGVILGALFLKEPVTIARGFVIACAFTGLYIILGGDGGLPLPRNIGDLFALTSGILWAIGSLGLVRSKAVPAIPQIIAFLCGGLVISLITHAAIGAPLAIDITAEAAGKIGLTALVYGFYALPMIWLTIAPAQLLSPARVGILLMSEVIIGVTSAALLSGDPFGPLEAYGTILIVLAAFIEVKTTKVG